MTHALSAACSKVLRTRVPRHHAWICTAFCSWSGCFFFFAGRGCQDKEGILREHSPPTSAPRHAKRGFLRSSGAPGREPVDHRGVLSLPLSLNGPGHIPLPLRLRLLICKTERAGTSHPAITRTRSACLEQARHASCSTRAWPPTWAACAFPCTPEAGEAASSVCFHASLSSTHNLLCPSVKSQY